MSVHSSGVGVLDKSVAIVAAAATGPAALSDLVERTGITRPTAHRLAVALEHHGLLSRDDDGRFVLGPRIAEWSGSGDRLTHAAASVVVTLRDATRESAQVYRRADSQRLCIASAEPAAGLRDTVPVGSLLSMKAGSAAQVLAAWMPAEQRRTALHGAAFSATTLAEVRRGGWAHSIGQREAGVASISAPVFDEEGTVVAAVSISGPIERLARPSRAQIRALRDAAESLGTALTS